jgi:hypothetical protein
MHSCQSAARPATSQAQPPAHLSVLLQKQLKDKSCKRAATSKVAIDHSLTDVLVL